MLGEGNGLSVIEVGALIDRISGPSPMGCFRSIRIDVDLRLLFIFRVSAEAVLYNLVACGSRSNPSSVRVQVEFLVSDYTVPAEPVGYVVSCCMGHSVP